MRLSLILLLSLFSFQLYAQCMPDSETYLCHNETYEKLETNTTNKTIEENGFIEVIQAQGGELVTFTLDLFNDGSRGDISNHHIEVLKIEPDIAGYVSENKNISQSSFGIASNDIGRASVKFKAPMQLGTFKVSFVILDQANNDTHPTSGSRLYTKVNVTDLPSSPPPEITSVTPSSLFAGQSPTTLTITGENFSNNPIVYVAGINFGSIVSNSGSKIEIEILEVYASADGVEGYRDVIVKNTDEAKVTKADLLYVSDSEPTDPTPDPIDPEPTVNTAPTLKLISAPESIYLAETFIIQLQATDAEDNVDNIQVDFTGQGNDDGAVKSASANSGETVSLDYIYSENAYITWTATAYDSEGLASEMKIGQLKVGNPNVAPSLEVVSSPAIVGVNVPYTIQLKATDTDGNLQKIGVDFTGKGGDDGNVVEQGVSDGEVATFTFNYPKEAFITWTATAYDEQNVGSEMVKRRVQVGNPAVSYHKNNSYLHGLNATGGSNGVSCPKCSENTGLVADPINVRTGAQEITYKLLDVKGVLPIEFRLSYNSLLTDEFIVGKGWHLNGLHGYLKTLSNGDIKILWSENYENTYLKQTDGSYQCEYPVCQFDELVANSVGGYDLTRDKTTYVFRDTGKLTVIRNQYDQELRLNHATSGRITKITEPVTGVFLEYEYNDLGLLERVSDNLERNVQLNYDSNKQLIEIRDVLGDSTRFTYTANGQIESATLSDGTVLFKNIYDAAGRVIEQDDASPETPPIQLSYDYNQPDALVSAYADKAGQSHVYEYDDNFNLLSYTNPLGAKQVHEYSDNNLLISSTDANGNAVSLSYDVRGNVTQITNAKNQTAQMQYDADDNLIAVTDNLQRTTSLSYDNQLLTQITNPNQETTQFTYTPTGQIDTITSPTGLTQQFVYTHGFVTAVIDEKGRESQLTYDTVGRLSAITDVSGATTTLTYDAANRIIAVTDALNRTIQFEYNNRDKVTQITDAKGNMTQSVYDANGYLISSTNPLNQTTHYEYDAEGRVLKVIDAAQQTTLFERDAAGRVVKVTDSLGRSQARKLDAVGNVLAEIDGFNQTVARFDYDALYNIESIHDGLGRSAQFAYDAGNRLTQAIDSLQRVTQFDYDVLDRLQTSVDALGGESQQDFDAEGLLSSFADTNQNQTRFTYDATGQVETMQTASGGEIRYGYDARDLLVSVTNGRGQVRDLTYDVIGRLTGWTDTEGQVQVTYDDNDNVLTVSDVQGTIRRSYDALDRVVSYTDVFGNQIGYEYDALGQLVTVVYPDGKTVRYGYDAAGQLVSVTDWANRQTAYAYDVNGRLVKTVRPNGSQQLREYDVVGQLLSMQDVDSSGQVIVRYDFRYDLAGNIVEERVTPTPALMDLLPVTMDYAAGNQLAHVNTAAMQFDADNNMLQGVLNGELVDFAYDSRNRLTAVGAMAYRYDAENHRVGVVVNGDETRYVVNALPALSQVLVREQANGSQTFYVYGLGLIGEESAAGYLSYHFDLRGSTVALSGIDGSVVQRFQYSPYGGLVSESPALVDTPFLYNGRDGVMTDDTGLYYMRARYYNPEIRRFVNQDPLLGFVADGQSLNRYAYVTGEPVSYVDPFGLEPKAFAGSTLNTNNLLEIGSTVNNIQLQNDDSSINMTAINAAAVLYSDAVTNYARCNMNGQAAKITSSIFGNKSRLINGTFYSAKIADAEESEKLKVVFAEGAGLAMAEVSTTTCATFVAKKTKKVILATGVGLACGIAGGVVGSNVGKVVVDKGTELENAYKKKISEITQPTIRSNISKLSKYENDCILYPELNCGLQSGSIEHKAYVLQKAWGIPDFDRDSWIYKWSIGGG